MTSPEQQRESDLSHSARKLVPITTAHLHPQRASRQGEKKLVKVLRDLSEVDEVDGLEVRSDLSEGTVSKGSDGEKGSESTHLGEQVERETKDEVAVVLRLRRCPLALVRRSLRLAGRAARLLLRRFGCPERESGRRDEETNSQLYRSEDALKESRLLTGTVAITHTLPTPSLALVPAPARSPTRSLIRIAPEPVLVAARFLVADTSLSGTSGHAEEVGEAESEK